MNKRIPLTAQAHQLIQNYLRIGDSAIDATAGNGHDTLFLAKSVGDSGQVFAFDIQQQAIDSTRQHIVEQLNMDRVELFHCSHERMQDHIPSQYHGQIKAVIFNLGYLPGSDKAVITHQHSTIKALQQALQILACPGIVCITAYPGHAGGEQELHALEGFFQQLDKQLYITACLNKAEKPSAPRLYSIEKLKHTEG